MTLFVRILPEEVGHPAVQTPGHSFMLASRVAMR